MFLVPGFNENHYSDNPFTQERIQFFFKEGVVGMTGCDTDVKFTECVGDTLKGINLSE